jgi:hypothetical protein
MKKALPAIGLLAFVLGILIAVFFGVFPFGPEVTNIVIVVLLILGVIVGFINITAKEIIPLLIATVALVVVGRVFEPVTAFGIGNILNNVLILISTLVAPAAVIAAMKIIINVGFSRD